MVLVSRPFGRFCLLTALLSPAVAHAQSIERTAPALEEVEDFQPIGIRVGQIMIQPSAEIGLIYDSNIFAAPNNEQSDFRAVIAPRLVVTHQGNTVRVRGTAQAEINRYFDLTTEDNTAGLTRLDTVVRVSEADEIRTDAYWQRVVEDRGDPEAQNVLGTGRRLLDAYNGEIEYSHSGNRIGFSLLAGFTKFDYRAAVDSERDHDTVRVAGRIGYRVGARTSVYIRPFYSARDFRLATDNSGVNRDSNTYGARAGIEIDPGGLVRGRFAVGAFRFSPDDPTLQSRTGLSVQGSILYEPSQRTVVSAEVFRGDVATFRAGATAREDTRVTVGIQQEIRHNLRWQSAVFYRRTNFVNGGDEDTVGAFGELEYRLNRFLAVAATARYSHRSSSRPVDEFDRFRGGIELRVRY